MTEQRGRTRRPQGTDPRQRRRTGGRGDRRARPDQTVRMAPVQVGDELELTVDRLGYRGEGVARHEGFAVFIEGALPGERVQARVTQVARSFAHAHLHTVLTPATERVVPLCAVYDLCGGCQLQHLSYAGQLQFKRQAVVDALTRIGKFPSQAVEALVRSTIPMDEPWRYRNKVQVAAAVRGGRFVIGFVEEGTHEPVEASECLIRPVGHDQVLAKTLEVIDHYAIGAYDEASGQGDVTRIAIRTTKGGEVLLIVDTAGASLPHAKAFASALAAKVDGIEEEEASDARGLGRPRIRLAGIVHQPSSGASRVLYGVPYVDETIAGLDFRVSADSFLQVNPVQTERLYQEAIQAAVLETEDFVWDLYCGIGTLSLLAAQHCRRVVGIEEVEQAVDDAKANATRNGLPHADFVAGRVEQAIVDLLEREGPPDVVLLDPPRAGCAPEVLAALLVASPRRIVYVSCNPATLARDLRLLADGGYESRLIQPLDMFPQTAHVECCVSLVRSS
ncbi:MAG: 23S rRNA (uracil(1939)-C(5))-methyltransferase RlmD [Firmicutes bacterium]|nr:23S rRNA (uracil(1939)-C(5))-methyltransferase RlmD [Bacillota bacterium]